MNKYSRSKGQAGPVWVESYLDCLKKFSLRIRCFSRSTSRIIQLEDTNASHKQHELSDQCIPLLANRLPPSCCRVSKKRNTIKIGVPTCCPVPCCSWKNSCQWKFSAVGRYRAQTILFTVAHAASEPFALARRAGPRYRYPASMPSTTHGTYEGQR